MMRSRENWVNILTFLKKRSHSHKGKELKVKHKNKKPHYVKKTTLNKGQTYMQAGENDYCIFPAVKIAIVSWVKGS